jgi:4-aminobutyrate aminotransferase
MSDTRRVDDHLASVWARPWDLAVERGEGAYLWSESGERYLDFTSGIGVTNTGHCHPRVVAAACEQAGRLVHGQANLTRHGPMKRLAAALRDVVPPALDTFFFSNSGAEAVEAALKLSRQTTGRPNVIAFEGGFHGRTVATMSLTSSKTGFRAGYQPLMPGVFFAPFPSCSHCRIGPSGGECCDTALERLRHLLATQTSPAETAAILVEPVLGEGGYVVPPDSFLPGLRRICDEYGILLIVDEIQSGFGRTGEFFAIDHWGVVPDVLVMAKGLASGFPLSGIGASRALMDRWPTGSHGGTYGGNAVACAAAEATIRVLLEEDMVGNARTQGAVLVRALRELQAVVPAIGDVRGLGLMVAVEFVQPGTRQPNPGLAKTVQAACFERNLMLLTCGAYEHVIRWIPPLNVTAHQLTSATTIFRAAVDEWAVAAV